MRHEAADELARQPTRIACSRGSECSWIFLVLFWKLRKYYNGCIKSTPNGPAAVRLLLLSRYIMDLQMWPTAKGVWLAVLLDVTFAESASSRQTMQRRWSTDSNEHCKHRFLLHEHCKQRPNTRLHCKRYLITGGCNVLSGKRITEKILKSVRCWSCLEEIRPSVAISQ